MENQEFQLLPLLLRLLLEDFLHLLLPLLRLHPKRSYFHHLLLRKYPKNQTKRRNKRRL
jgi:hypothetical protein